MQNNQKHHNNLASELFESQLQQLSDTNNAPLHVSFHKFATLIDIQDYDRKHIWHAKCALTQPHVSTEHK